MQYYVSLLILSSLLYISIKCLERTGLPARIYERYVSKLSPNFPFLSVPSVPSTSRHISPYLFPSILPSCHFFSLLSFFLARVRMLTYIPYLPHSTPPYFSSLFLYLHHTISIP